MVEAWVDRTGWWEPVFDAGDFDMMASDGAFSAQRLILFPELGRPGVAEGSTVRGMIAVNMRFPFPPELQDPLPLWTVQWTTEDFRPRDVRVSLEKMSYYYVRPYPWEGPVNTYPDRVQPPADVWIRVTGEPECYADCDTSTGWGALDIFDFLCFQNRFVAMSAYACDCDTATGQGLCDIFDFLCFQNAFVEGCP